MAIVLSSASKPKPENGLRIGIDLMGSDSAPQVLFDAVLKARENLSPSAVLVVFATSDVFNSLKSASALQKSAIEFVVAEESISMQDDPLVAIRRKKRSSLVLGLKALKKNRIDAFVSAGNTGALVSCATLSIPKLPGIYRPALLATLPTRKNPMVVIDVGGNVSCRASHLVQFAQMGAAYQRCLLGIQSPRVGLLNIGVESKKGTAEVRQAYQLIQEQCQELNGQGMEFALHFLGNIEARDIFEGNVDVLVTNGFTGNVLLKSVEGVSSFIFDSLYSASKNIASKLFEEGLNDLQRYFNYAEYPGAIVCGIDGIVIKCHGEASVKAFYSSILGAHRLCSERLIERIKQQFHS